MLINSLLIIIIAFANITLGLLIYSRNKASLANKLFFIDTILLTLWMLCNYFLHLSTQNINVANLLNAAAYTFGFLALYVAFLFSQAYPTEHGIIKRKKYLS